MSDDMLDLKVAVAALKKSSHTALGIPRSTTQIVRMNFALFEYLISQGVEQKRLPQYLADEGWSKAASISHKTFSAAIARVRREQEVAAARIDQHKSATIDKDPHRPTPIDTDPHQLLKIATDLQRIAPTYIKPQSFDDVQVEVMRPSSISQYRAEKPPDKPDEKADAAVQQRDANREAEFERRQKILRGMENENH